MASIACGLLSHVIVLLQRVECITASEVYLGGKRAGEKNRKGTVSPFVTVAEGN